MNLISFWLNIVKLIKILLIKMQCFSPPFTSKISYQKKKIIIIFFYRWKVLKSQSGSHNLFINHSVFFTFMLQKFWHKIFILLLQFYSSQESFKDLVSLTLKKRSFVTAKNLCCKIFLNKSLERKRFLIYNLLNYY